MAIEDTRGLLRVGLCHRVLVVRRLRYACTDGVVQTPTPAWLIKGGLPTDATVAQVLVSK